MNSFKDRLTSRKFLAFLGSVFVLVGGLLQGEVSMEKAISSIVTLTITYIASEALVDAARARVGEPKE